MADSLLERLQRLPFEGLTARVYSRSARPAFSDLDARLCEAWAPDLSRARSLLDVGAGTGSFLLHARARFPHLSLLAVEPSRDFAPALRAASLPVVRARGEALPLRAASVDVAVSLSSIRHVQDCLAVLTELRRVVTPRGCAFIVELDPAATDERAKHHIRGLGSALLRWSFEALVLRTAPPVEELEQTALAAGWTQLERTLDPLQPVYCLRLSATGT